MSATVAKTNKRRTNKAVQTSLGKFRSKFEAEIAQKLLDKDITWGYEKEKLVYVSPVKYYTPDFVIYNDDGTKTYVEVKGYLDAKSKEKMVLIRRQYPDLRIAFLFKRNNKLHPRSKQTYYDWAKKNGFELYTL